MIHQNTYSKNRYFDFCSADKGSHFPPGIKPQGVPIMGVNWLGEPVGRGQFAQQSPGTTHLRPGLIATDQQRWQIPAIVHR
jgi:hypothetical protein